MTDNPLRRDPADTEDVWAEKLEARKREAERRMAEHDAKMAMKHD